MMIRASHVRAEIARTLACDTAREMHTLHVTDRKLSACKAGGPGHTLIGCRRKRASSYHLLLVTLRSPHSLKKAVSIEQCLLPMMRPPVAGKTYTLSSIQPDAIGMMPRAAAEVFARIAADVTHHHTVFMSYIQIYMELLQVRAVKTSSRNQ